jgi:hypothetical protein
VAQCLGAIRKRIRIEVGIVGIQNASFDPSLGPRVFDGIYRELFNRGLKGIVVFDKTRWQNVPPDNKTIRLSVELTALPPKVFTRECVRTEERRYQAGTIRVRNQEHDYFSRRMEILESRQLQLQQEERGHTAQMWSSGFYALAGPAARVGELTAVGSASGLWGADLANSVRDSALREGIASGAIGGLGGLIGSAIIRGEVKDNLAGISTELTKVKTSMEDMDPFIDEPIYKEFIDNRTYYFRTARGRCGIKIVEKQTGGVVSVREVVESVVSSDRYVPGNRLAGVAPDPKDLPPEEEMTELALNKLVKAATDDIEQMIGQLLLGYCARASQADADKNEGKAIEDGASFLASNAVRTHPDYACVVGTFFDKRVSELVPTSNSGDGKWAEQLFGIVLKQRDPRTRIRVPGAKLHGILIVYQNLGISNDPETVAEQLTDILEDRDRGVTTKSQDKLGVVNEFREGQTLVLASYGKKLGERIVIRVTAETQSKGTVKVYNAQMHKERAEVGIVAVDALTGKMLLEREVKSEGTDLNKDAAKRAALKKSLQQVQGALLAALQEALEAE